MKSNTEACNAALLDSGNKVEELRGVAARAELVAKAAQSEFEAAEASMISEDNSWVEAEDAITYIKLAIKSFDQKDQDLASELEARQASLQRFQVLMAQFGALKDPVPLTFAPGWRPRPRVPKLLRQQSRKCRP